MPAQDDLGVRPGEKVLFVASTGGHLSQLNRFSSLYAPANDSMWVTFETPQSESLLVGRRKFFVPYIAPRDTRAIWKSFLAIRQLLRNEHFDRVISTGAGLAVGAFLAAKTAGVPCRYIESVSRVEGPSLTGKIVERLHLADLFTQHDNWVSEKWKRHPSVLAQFRAVEDSPRIGKDGLKVFVTLGTIRPYPFDSAVDALLNVGGANDGTIWQLGSTKRKNLPGQVFEEMSAEAFTTAAKGADVVVTHAGVGTILQLLELGIHPVVLPRRSDKGEHVDDHQLQITRLVSNLGVATAIDPSVLEFDHLLVAAGKRTEAGQDANEAHS